MEKMTSEKCLQQFILEYQGRLDVNTLALYQRAVTQMLAYCNQSFYTITVQDIRSWMLQLEKEKLKPSTISTKLFGLRLFFDYCVDEELISSNPLQSIQFPKIEEKLPRYLRKEQLLELRQLVRENQMERAIVELLYTSGVRISEFTAIQQGDIDWEERTIHIPKGKRKKARIVLFTRECAEYLQAYLQGRSDSRPELFLNAKGAPLSVRTIQMRFQKYAKDLGISLTPHTLRHTFAAHLAIKGMPLMCIQSLLGHENLQQSQLYARLYNEARKLQYDTWM
ncbi:tyrosine-type recombinase/integrase [Solibacillus sp. FSL R5-0691]|uniref:tyrosine-type recombinase/integrase n=1 Tax=Solibacillus sp. FSL R5-0691 TaxID=2921653 RepID=UPI0030CC333E